MASPGDAKPKFYTEEKKNDKLQSNSLYQSFFPSILGVCWRRLIKAKPPSSSNQRRICPFLLVKCNMLCHDSMYGWIIMDHNLCNTRTLSHDPKLALWYKRATKTQQQSSARCWSSITINLQQFTNPRRSDNRAVMLTEMRQMMSLISKESVHRNHSKLLYL